MDNEGRKWLFGGMGLVLVLALLMPLADDTTPLIPIPYHQFVLWFVASYGYFLVLPILYGVTLRLLWPRELFRGFTLAVCSVFAVATLVWFWSNWQRGDGYPGASFTNSVALENAAGIAALLVLSLVGYLRARRRYSATAYLLLFAMLAWCAFPVLWRVDL